jgi:hypothetical protein
MASFGVRYANRMGLHLQIMHHMQVPILMIQFHMLLVTLVGSMEI